MPGRPFLLRFLAILLSGCMVAVLVPPFSFSGLVWICVIPLLIALWTLKGKHRAKKGFLIGYLTGAIAFGIQVSWLSTVSWLAPIALSSYLALYFGFFGAFAATLGNPWHRKEPLINNPLQSLLIAFQNAAIFAGLEIARGWVLTGFGWNALGVAFHDTAVMAQGADLLGVSGLTLAIIFFQAVMIQVGNRMFRAGATGIRAPRWDFLVAAMTIGALLLYGIVRISLEKSKETIPLKALLIQINIPHEGARVLWEAEEVHMAYEDETLTALENLILEDEKKLQNAVQESEEGSIELTRPDWVLWPEVALTGRLFTTDDGQSGSWLNNVETISRVRSSPYSFDLIYGVIEVEGEAREDGIYQKKDAPFYNSLVFDGKDGAFQTFRKHHLVIFGETIPFIETLPFLKKIYEQQSGQSYQGSLSPGASLEPLKTKLNGTEIQIIPAICFEDTVPRLTRKFVRNAPQIIVNLTNDGWFKTSPASEQHFANARFRAIELRRPMLRCANTGVTAAIDTIGSTIHPTTGKNQVILDENSSPFTRGSVLAEIGIPLQPSFSLYALIGDAGLLLISFTALVTVIFSRKNKNHPDFDPTDPFGKKRPKNP